MHQMKAHFKAQFSYDLNDGHGRGMAAVPATGDGLVAPCASGISAQTDTRLCDPT
jgi:hypothetical protein